MEYTIKVVVTLESGEEQTRSYSVDAYSMDQAIGKAKKLASEEDGVVEVEARIK